eukprot:GHVT01040356.1.p1 GENE.GHVT01040356.1~~GHVT01040356.1.p1  ORF type:complete len:1529 (-),score=184.74 GHVT01040356.1:1739-6325(-)
MSRPPPGRQSSEVCAPPRQLFVPYLPENGQPLSRKCSLQPLPVRRQTPLWCSPRRTAQSLLLLMIVLISKGYNTPLNCPVSRGCSDIWLALPAAAELTSAGSSLTNLFSPGVSLQPPNIRKFGSLSSKRDVQDTDSNNSDFQSGDGLTALLLPLVPNLELPVARHDSGSEALDEARTASAASNFPVGCHSLAEFPKSLPSLCEGCAGSLEFRRLAPIPNGVPLTETTGTFREQTYEEILSQFEKLATDFPHLVQITTARKRYKHLNWNSDWYKCGNKDCEIPIIHLATKETLRPSTPEIFFSGTVHGNERIGPNAALELALFLCHTYGVSKQITYLLNHRSIYIMPFPNSWGYAKNTRTENWHDPNRDFPYSRQAGSCMVTYAAKAVNEIFREHVFRLAVTWHGGVRVISYPWGSLDHSYRDPSQHYSKWKSRNAPDHSALKEVASELQAAAGRDSSGEWFYPEGTMTDTVYPVVGGMEDWAYGGWQESPNPISVCKPTENGGYPSDRTVYEQNMLRCAMYLVEASDEKEPKEAEYGGADDLWNPNPVCPCHIPRNTRIGLKMIELAEPDILITSRPSETASSGSELSFSFYGIGCVQVTSSQLVLVRGECPSPLAAPSVWHRRAVASSAPNGGGGSCRGLGVWQNLDDPEKDRERRELTTRLSLPHTLSGGNYCVALLVKFDQQWGRQQNPEPPVSPSSHLVRARLNDGYRATTSESSSVVLGAQTWVFPRSMQGESSGADAAGITAVGLPLTVTPAPQTGVASAIVSLWLGAGSALKVTPETSAGVAATSVQETHPIASHPHRPGDNASPSSVASGPTAVRHLSSGGEKNSNVGSFLLTFRHKSRRQPPGASHTGNVEVDPFAAEIVSTKSDEQDEAQEDNAQAPPRGATDTNETNEPSVSPEPVKAVEAPAAKAESEGGSAVTNLASAVAAPANASPAQSLDGLADPARVAADADRVAGDNGTLAHDDQQGKVDGAQPTSGAPLSSAPDPSGAVKSDQPRRLDEGAEGEAEGPRAQSAQPPDGFLAEIFTRMDEGNFLPLAGTYGLWLLPSADLLEGWRLDLSAETLELGTSSTGLPLSVVSREVATAHGKLPGPVQLLTFQLSPEQLLKLQHAHQGAAGDGDLDSTQESTPGWVPLLAATLPLNLPGLLGRAVVLKRVDLDGPKPRAAGEETENEIEESTGHMLDKGIGIIQAGLPEAPASSLYLPMERSPSPFPDAEDAPPPPLLACVFTQQTIQRPFNPSEAIGFLHLELQADSSLHISGELCRLPALVPKEIYSLFSVSGCCGGFNVTRPAPLLLSPWRDRVVTIDQLFAPGRCYCGPGSNFSVRTPAGETFSCTVAYPTIPSTLNDYSAGICDRRRLYVPKYATRFRPWQIILLVILATLTFLLLLVPCLVGAVRLWRVLRPSGRWRGAEYIPFSGIEPPRVQSAEIEATGGVPSRQFGATIGNVESPRHSFSAAMITAIGAAEPIEISPFELPSDEDLDAYDMGSTGDEDDGMYMDEPGGQLGHFQRFRATLPSSISFA